MEQYNSEGSTDKLAKPVTVSVETKQIQSIGTTVKQLQETVNIQHQEIMKLHRDVTRLKDQISDLANIIGSVTRRG